MIYLQRLTLEILKVIITYVMKKNEDMPLDEQLEVLPFHVVILDEVADLMMVASKQVRRLYHAYCSNG